MIPYQDVEKMAVAVAKSGLFGAKSPEAALSLMLIAQAEGKHPAMACQEYDIIQGRHALKSSAMLGRFQQSGGIVKWIKHEDDEVIAEFSHKNSPSPLTISWNMDRARKAELTKNATWSKYPRQMLRARVISEGVRATYPASCGGFYTPEEVQDFSDPIGKPVVAMPKAVEVAKNQPQVAQEAVIVDKPSESIGFNKENAIKSLASIEKIIGKEAYAVVLKKVGIEKSEDVINTEIYNSVSKLAWEVKQEQKKAKNA